jgi:hypothetical protein
MDELNFPNALPDKGDRRSGIERRRFQYTSHIPERRSGHDRRSGFDRRSGIDQRRLDQKNGVERRTAFRSTPVSPGE